MRSVILETSIPPISVWSLLAPADVHNGNSTGFSGIRYLNYYLLLPTYRRRPTEADGMVVLQSARRIVLCPFRRRLAGYVVIVFC